MRDMQTPAAKLGRHIRWKRRGRPSWIDQGVLAQKAGMSQANLSRIEAGKVCASLDAICRIAAAFDMAPSALLAEAGL